MTIEELKRALVEVSELCETFWKSGKCTSPCPLFNLSAFECPMQQSRIPCHWEVDCWKEDSNIESHKSNL